MIIFLHGEENFLSLQKLKSIKKLFAQKHKGDIIVIEGENFNINQFKSHLNTFGLFSQKKLIILKNLITDGASDNLKKVERVIENVDKNIIIVFYERKKVDKKLSLYKKLDKITSKNGKKLYPEFTKLQFLEIQKRIVNKLNKHGKQISKDALELLTNNCSNMWEAHYETEKIIYSPYNKITYNTLIKLIQPKIDANIFALTDAISSKDLKQSLKLLNNMLSYNPDPLYLLFMISRQIKILIKIKSIQKKLKIQKVNYNYKLIANEINEHPYVVQKTAKFLNNFSKHSLVLLYEKILNTDIKIKTSRTPPKILLTKLVYDIIL